MATCGRVQTYRLSNFMQKERLLITAKQTLSKLKYQRCLGLESAKLRTRYDQIYPVPYFLITHDNEEIPKHNNRSVSITCLIHGSGK